MAAGRGAERARDGAARRGPRQRRGGGAAGGRARGGGFGGPRGPRRARTRQARAGDGAEPDRNPKKARRRGTMKTTLVLGALAAALVTAAPGWADHNRRVAPDDAERNANAESAKPEGSTTDATLDIDLKLGLNGFRLGGRLFGREGYAGGAPCERKAHNFKMNVELDEWLRRAARWWS